tara:strand:+ start:334 stop:810 length:477 start_codon:yes stop_codon:yes gene_type:complete
MWDVGEGGMTADQADSQTRARAGKRSGRHRENQLTAISARKKGPGRHSDGKGLYLVVDPSGARRWVLRVMVQGRRLDIGLGGASVVSLAEAREAAQQLRKIARAGGDPRAVRDREKRSSLTLAQSGMRGACPAGAADLPECEGERTVDVIALLRKRTA